MATPPPELARAPLSPTFNFQVAVDKFAGGTNQNPESFIRAIESAQALYGWSDAQTLAYASINLKGKAMEWFDNHDTTLTWPSFKRALAKRFGPDPGKMLSALTTRVQAENESVRDYADAMRRIVRHSRDPHLKPTLMPFFIEGLRDDVATFVKTRRPSTFEEAVAESEYYEDNFKPSRAAAPESAAAPGYTPPAPRPNHFAAQENLSPPAAKALTRKLGWLYLKIMELLDPAQE